MYIGDTTLTASQVLRAFHRDALYLFLGAAFTTIGLVAAAFNFLRRKSDALLTWFALFAILYGQRLWLNSGMVALMVPPSAFFDNFRAASNEIVPIPAFFYFQAVGFLSRFGRKIAYAMTAIFLALSVWALLSGPLSLINRINSVIIIATFCALIIDSVGQKTASPDSIVIRRGLLIFAAFVLTGNISVMAGHFLYVEPVGFVFLLGALGIVATGRTAHRDQELAEVQRELDIAKRIQVGNLPVAFANSTSFQVASRYVPMTSVAGDFYDFIVATDQELGILIADVSGHGIPAALIASMVKLAASSQRSNASDPAALLSGMNAALCGNTQGQFVTAAYVHLDATSARLLYSAAAHPPMLLLRDGVVSEIVENGLMLAAFSFAEFATASHELRPDDRIVLYTDGIVEASNGRLEEFGQARLQALLKQSAQLSPEETVDLVIRSVQGWSKTQDDDLTLLVCDFKGSRAENEGFREQANRTPL